MRGGRNRAILFLDPMDIFACMRPLYHRQAYISNIFAADSYCTGKEFLDKMVGYEVKLRIEE